jgi:hypothetical protein
LGYILGLYALYWFKKLKLDIKYQKEIEEWLLYTKQEKFSKKLDRQMLAEIERYMNGKKTIEELIKEKFPQVIHPIEYL